MIDALPDVDNRIGQGDLPPGWASTSLSDVCSVIQGQSPPGHTYNTEGAGLPFLQGKAEFGDIYPEAIKWCSVPNKIAEPGDVLISVRAPVGPTNLCATQSCIGRGLAAIRPEGGIPSKYVLYAIRGGQEELLAKATGTTFEAVKGDDVRAHAIPIAPLPEQHRIVAEIETQFTRLDASVAALRRTQANLKRYRASVLRAACSGELVPTEAELARAEGREYEPADVLLERILVERRARWEAQETRRGKYKEPAAPDTSDLPTLPDGWVWATVGQCFDVYVGSTPSRKRDDYWRGEIAWVSSGEVTINRITTTRESITEAGYASSSVNLHPQGTVLLGMIGEGKTRGQVAILDIPACNSQNSAAIRVSEAGLSPEFVFYHLMGQYEATRMIGSGNNQPALNKSRVQEIVLPLPPLAEQRRIVAEVERRLSVIQQAEAAVEASLQRAERLRQSILKRAFAGELVPQDPDDEPASILLERIRAQREAEQAAASASKKRPARRRRTKAAEQLTLEEAPT